MDSAFPDRLAIITLSGIQVDALFNKLATEKFTFTLINSTGGLLQEPEISILLGFHSDKLPALLEVVRENCRPYRIYVPAGGLVQGDMAVPPMVEAEMGGARFYLMKVERFEQI